MKTEKEKIQGVIQSLQLDGFLEQWKLDARETFAAQIAEPLCPYCKMPEMSCICSQYDIKGNEL